MPLLANFEFGLRVFDGFVVSLAFLANCIALFAAIRCKMSMTGYRHFLISLSAGNVFISIVHVMSLIYQENLARGNEQNRPLDDAADNFIICGANIIRILKLVGFLANLFNICGMTVDHLIGIIRPMKYQQMMDRRLTQISVVVIWIVSFSLAFLDVPLWIYDYTKAPTEFHNEDFSQAFMSNLNGALGLAKLEIQQAELLLTATSAMPMTVTPLLQPVMFVNSHSNVPSTAVSQHDGESVLNDDKVDKAIEHLLEVLQIEDDPQNFRKNSCVLIGAGKMLTEIVIIALAAVCFLTLIVCYGLIFKKILKRRPESASSKNLGTTVKISRKSVFTTLMFLGAFVVCWMPFMINELTMVLVFQTSDNYSRQVPRDYSKFVMLGHVLSSLLMLYPLVDPIIYAARIPAIQQYIMLHLSLIFNCPFFMRYLNDHNQKVVTSRISSVRSSSSDGRISVMVARIVGSPSYSEGKYSLAAPRMTRLTVSRSYDSRYAGMGLARLTSSTSQV